MRAIAGIAKLRFELGGIGARRLADAAPGRIDIAYGAFYFGGGGIRAERSKTRDQCFTRNLVCLEFGIARAEYRIALRENGIGRRLEFFPQRIFDIARQRQRPGMLLPFTLQVAHLGDEIAILRFSGGFGAERLGALDEFFALRLRRAARLLDRRFEARDAGMHALQEFLAGFVRHRVFQRPQFAPLGLEIFQRMGQCFPVRRLRLVGIGAWLAVVDCIRYGYRIQHGDQLVARFQIFLARRFQFGKVRYDR